MRALFLTGGTNDPATRFRALQFFPHLEERGIQCFHRGAYGSAYNHLFHIPVVGPGYKLAGRLRRAWSTVSATAFDAIVLQRTAFNGTALPERILAARNASLIYDVDDAVFLSQDGGPDVNRQQTFASAVRVAAHVTAGNDYLAAQARAPEKTSILRTVVDTDVYTPLTGRAARSPQSRLVIGWMGTASNFRYFSEIDVALRQVLSEFPEAVFRIVSNGRYRGLEGHPQVEHVAWSEATELRDLRSFDIGIMPLIDTAWTRGKCGFKMIQYMSVGCPVVASPVGVNTEVLGGETAGFLASSPHDWVAALRTLLTNEPLRRELGRLGRLRAERHYSVRSVVDVFAEIIERVASGTAVEARLTA